MWINYLLYLCIHLHVVPAPSSISITTVNAQTVSQSLTLECNITTVRGITSRVDIVWSSNSVELKRIEGANINFTSDITVVYTSSYDLSQLNTSDDGRVFKCKMIVNVSPLVVAGGNITLDLTGKQFYNYVL